MIWQLEKGNKGRWKTLNNSVIALLEDAHQNKEMDVKHKSLAVSVYYVLNLIMPSVTMPGFCLGVVEWWSNSISKTLLLAKRTFSHIKNTVNKVEH